MSPDAPQYYIGQVVYFAPKQDMSGMVTAVLFTPIGPQYQVTWSDFGVRYHYAVELVAEKTWTITEGTK